MKCIGYERCSQCNTTSNFDEAFDGYCDKCGAKSSLYEDCGECKYSATFDGYCERCKEKCEYEKYDAKTVSKKSDYDKLSPDKSSSEKSSYDQKDEKPYVFERCDACNEEHYWDGQCDKCGEKSYRTEYCPICGAKSEREESMDGFCDNCGKKSYCYERCDKCGYDHYYDGYCDRCGIKSTYENGYGEYCDMYCKEKQKPVPMPVKDSYDSAKAYYGDDKSMKGEYMDNVANGAYDYSTTGLLVVVPV